MFGIPYAALGIFMLVIALLDIALASRAWNAGMAGLAAVWAVVACIALFCAAWWAFRAIEGKAEPEPAGVVVTVIPTITATAPADAVVTVTPTAGMPS